MVRRPDVVIVNDPSKPPTQNNLAAVVEMKFQADSPKPGQIEAYQEIAGGDANRVVELNESECNCKPEKKKQEQEAPVPVPVRVPAPSRHTTNMLVGVGLLIVAAAAIFTPVPGDEVAAGVAGFAALGVSF
jgi:hypothetical protein